MGMLSFGTSPGQRPPVQPLAPGAVHRIVPGAASTPLFGGGVEYQVPGTNTTVHTGPNGRITRIERTLADGSRMVVDRTLRGERRVEVVRRDRVRVVTEGRSGFVERPLRPGYVSRTYVAGGRTQVFVYGTYIYRGIGYYRYVPRVYYAPAFDEWACRPWGAQVVYAWGWGPAPVWFDGGYFVPTPYYADPTLWLTDYMLAENLRLAYEGRRAAGADMAAPPFSAAQTAFTLTAETKAIIAGEVQRQIQAEQAAGQQETAAPRASAQPADAPPPALDPSRRAFVVSASFDVTTTRGECSLTPGDVLFRAGDLQGTKVQMTVLNGKSGDCAANSVTAVEFATLQDMQNQFREQIAAGMETLASNQGKNGLPTGPAANPTPAPDGQAPPAPDAQAVLAQINQEADQLEAGIKQAPRIHRPAARPGKPVETTSDTVAGLHLTASQLNADLGVGNVTPPGAKRFVASGGWQGPGLYTFAAAGFTTPYLANIQQMNNWNYVLFRVPRIGVESGGLPQEVRPEVKVAVDNDQASGAQK